MIAELHIGDLMKGKIRVKDISPIINVPFMLPMAEWDFKNNPVPVMSFRYTRMVKKNVAYYDCIGIK